jgi:glycine dehydrogenase subunit 2
MVAAAWFRDRGQGSQRTKVLAPDSAHGTNPASAAMAGFDTVTVKSTPRGFVDMDDLRSKLDDRTAVFMITNPNTLGMFDRYIAEICRLVHQAGGLVYLDGANMNAILGIARPGDFGADMMHFNPHKTFSGPHGGGGPGAGPIAVTQELEPYLPSPVVRQEVRSGAATFRLQYDRPKSIGRVRSFFGNVGVLVRAYCYLRTHGPDGLRRVSENAVLNANYLLSRVKSVYPVPQGDRCMHEFVATASTLKAERGISAMDIAKRLLDYGFHAPTVYFPPIVKEAMMIEPTETESKETLDAFADALLKIAGEDPDRVHSAPHTTPIVRPDEVRAARQPVMKWTAKPAQAGAV